MKPVFKSEDYFVDAEEFKEQPKPTLPVCIPRKPFRIQKQSERHCYLICIEKRWYLVHPKIGRTAELPAIQKGILYLGIFEEGGLFLLPVTYPQTENKRSWFDGWQHIVDVARKRWITVTKNDHEQCYEDVYVQGLEPPHWWPDTTLESAITKAFTGRTLDSHNDPIFLSLKEKTKTSGWEDFEEEAD